VEARQTNRPEVLIELAAETGLDVPAFIERFNGGSAAAAFEADLRTAASSSARGFPTFLVRYGEKALLLRGYQRFETFQSVIKTITDGAVEDHVPQKSQEKVLEFIARQGRVAPVEIQAAFDFSVAELNAMLATLQEQQSIQVIPAGNGSLITAAVGSLACDPTTGLCIV
jgi:putative protein-disulfide isomerase